MTNRFFVAPEQIRGSRITILGSDARQIRTVLRLSEGDEIEVLDGSGSAYTARITSLASEGVLSEVLGTERVSSEPGIEIALIQSVPRESKMDLIIQKCTELGVSRITPMMSERTVIKLADDKKDKRLSRWRKIVKEAAEQSGRGTVPKVEEIISFKDALKEASGCELKLIPWEMESSTSIKNILINNKPIRRIAIIIGPEGGFSKEEIDAAKAEGFIPVSLGKRILRTETAGIAALSMISYEYEMR